MVGEKSRTGQAPFRHGKAAQQPGRIYCSHWDLNLTFSKLLNPHPSVCSSTFCTTCCLLSRSWAAKESMNGSMNFLVHLDIVFWGTRFRFSWTENGQKLKKCSSSLASSHLLWRTTHFDYIQDTFCVSDLATWLQNSITYNFWSRVAKHGTRSGS